MTDGQLHTRIEHAASVVEQAQALLIGAGAGMGVDSGLPDFRGTEGFWRAYPPFRNLGLAFEDLANPRWFIRDPQRAWGFYGHRRNLYRQTRPHAGFEILRRWAESMPDGYYVYTSNVDGHFQRAGFDPDRIVECHGSLEVCQCVDLCTRDIWPADDAVIDVDEATFRASGDLPECIHCGALARPNILMFGDFSWNHQRTVEQQRGYDAWGKQLAGKRVVVIECGAGTAIPSVRYECERRRGVLVRINPREAHGPADTISLPMGALDALDRMERALGSARG